MCFFSLGVSVAQGGALLTLYRGIENDWALSETPVLHLPLWIIALTAPTMFLIGVTADNLRRWLAATTAWTVLVALLAVWVGWSVTPAGQIPAGGIVGIAVACWLIGSFKALMYLQIWANREPLEYAGLFKYSWRNALVTALAGLLLFGTSVVLLLWGTLFDLIASISSNGCSERLVPVPVLLSRCWPRDTTFSRA